MIICSIDCEATGNDPKKDKITDIAAVLWEDNPFKEIERYNTLVYSKDYPKQTDEIIAITGITDEMLQKDGVNPNVALKHIAHMLGKADYSMAHNTQFDRELLRSNCLMLGFDIPQNPWICTYVDVPYPDKYKCKKLAHLALDHGVKMDGRVLHRAMADVELMMDLIRENYPIEGIVLYKNTPDLIIRAVVPKPWDDGGAGKDAAKAAGYRWQEVGGKVFTNMWVKKIKSPELDKEKSKVTFKIEILEGEIK